MPIKSFTAYEPSCDIEGCKFRLESDMIEWFTSPEDAASRWEECEGWTDLTTWICDPHRYLPHAFIPDEDDPEECARCGIELDEHEPMNAFVHPGEQP